MKRVLSIGNCGFDNGSISGVLRQEFGAETVTADDWQEAESLLKAGGIDLVIVNRKLDMDHSDGLAIIETIKQTEETASVPVMLLSNYAEYQEQAVALGAELGFGKAELRSPETKKKLAKLLA
jgi:two-component system chemotaxis response regulator CheY